MTFKKINPKEIEFYVLEISSVRFVIFDSKFDVPIYNGSWNMVEGIIKNIKEHTKNASIYYYTKQKSGDRKSTRLNSSHVSESRMPSSA